MSSLIGCYNIYVFIYRLSLHRLGLNSFACQQGGNYHKCWNNINK